MRSSIFVLVAAAAGLPTAALAQVFHNEVVNGDLSNNGMAPTAYVLGSGTGSLMATTGEGDIDYVAITVPAGMKLAALKVASFQGLDPIGFIAVMAGGQFTEPPGLPNPANMLGYSHFGPGFVGTDILDDMGVGFGAIGFTPPLPSGTYSFWLNQLGLAMTYQLDFEVTSSCYPDCNQSGNLTIADFGCFQAAFAAGQPYADCNQSSSLTIADFACFQAAFAAGCP